jgi:NADH-quinone oxidoreductase subunit M
MFTGVLSMWELELRVKEFFALFMFLVTGVFGVFMTMDLFFFCLFYEVAVLPMYLLIAVWGSTNKEYASLKLVLYLLAGSALMLTGVLALYYYSDIKTFNIIELATRANFSRSFQIAVFPLLAVGCGVLAAMWPLHTWSPDGHVAAPTAVSMLHAGVLMKLGAYGILRIAIWILPLGAIHWAPFMATLSLVNIVYGALVAIMQKDLKYMIGYSSVSHMGIVIFGLSTLNLHGMNGACFQMFSHGIMTALFFSSVGFIYDMAHTRNVDELGGIAKKIPLASSFFIVAGLCGLGLPTLSGFPAELLVYIGAYQAFKVYFWIAVVGLVLTAFYVLRIIQRGFFGPLNEKVAHHLHDATPWQAFPRVVLIITLVFFGLAPFTMLNLIQTATGPMVEGLQRLASVVGGM